MAVCEFHVGRQHRFRDVSWKKRCAQGRLGLVIDMLFSESDGAIARALALLPPEVLPGRGGPLVQLRRISSTSGYIE